MHRSRLISSSLIILALAACKKDEPAPAAAPQPSTASLALTQKTTPSGSIIAASTHFRFVDPAKGTLVARADLGRAVNAIVHSPDGAFAFAATSGGVYQLDVKSHTLLGQLTSSPARSVVLADGGQQLFVLEHDVVVEENGTRDIKPYRLKTIDIASGKAVGEEEIGQRIVYAYPSQGGRHHVVLTEDGAVIVGAANTPLSQGRSLELGQGPGRVRGIVAVFGGRAYVPIEGQPARMLDIDLASGESSLRELGPSMVIRGLSVTPDGKTLVLNAVRELVLIDRTAGTVRSRIELPSAHQGIAIAPDGKFAYMAQTIDGTGGAVGIVELEPLAFRGKVHLDDISPWAIGVGP